MSIRLASWDDVPAICNLIKMVRPEENFRGVTGGEYGHIGEFACRIMNNCDYFLWVAEHEGANFAIPKSPWSDNSSNVIGTAMMHVQRKLSFNRNMSAHLEEVYVHPDYRGRSIGTQLVDAATDKAIELGCYKIMLTCWERNRKYYTKLGF
jgi:GNAT superfamily N-acetyltransferase